MFQLIKRRLIAGLLAIVPIALTFWILRFLFRFLDSFTAPILNNLGVNQEQFKQLTIENPKRALTGEN